MQDVTHVLLVEDSRVEAALAEAILCGDENSPFKVVLARSLKEAIDRLSHGTYHAVLLDLNLPDSQGLETVQDILRADSLTPIIVLSGIKDEATAVESVQAGAQDYILKGDANGRQLRRAIRYAIERKRTELELARHALYDELTGLPSRKLLQDRWHGAIARAKRSKCWTGVLMIDLDKFKAINDDHGHLTGDRVLQEVAKRLTARLRGSDTIVRFGGDEFIVLLENIRSQSDANSIAATIREAIQVPIAVGNGTLTVSASVGVAVSHYSADDAMELVIELADKDMYAQKSDAFSPSGNKRAANDLQ